MTNPMSPNDFLDACAIDPAVLELRPDYRVQLLVVDGLSPNLGSDVADDLIRAAQDHAQALLAESTVDQLPHIAAWREAYRAFGAKPQRTRNSLEALTRRADKGLPRVNALTDIYNAISVLHQIPLGGEDFALYAGPARLIRATGQERFDTTADGEVVVEHPDPGEVVWCDDAGVTCRRWNWRQSRRTGLSEATRTAFFILDALAPVSDTELSTATDALIQALGVLSAGASIYRRVIGAP